VTPSIEFTPRSPKPVKATVIGTGVKTMLPRMATLTTIASASAAVSLSFNAADETFSYTHVGDPTTYTIALSSFEADGTLVTHTTSAAPVAGGDTCIFAPNWSQLAAGVGHVTVRGADGSVTSHTLN
jgi:hypothetical protein